jgi:Ca2+-binding EF-hand superfamily protein
MAETSAGESGAEPGAEPAAPLGAEPHAKVTPEPAAEPAAEPALQAEPIPEPAPESPPLQPTPTEPAATEPEPVPAVGPEPEASPATTEPEPEPEPEPGPTESSVSTTRAAPQDQAKSPRRTKQVRVSLAPAHRAARAPRAPLCPDLSNRPCHPAPPPMAQFSSAMRHLREAVAGNRKLFGQKVGDARALFAAADRDGSKLISAEEFHASMKRLDLGLTEQQIEEVMQEMDKDGDGSISYEEFLDASLLSSAGGGGGGSADEAAVRAAQAAHAAAKESAERRRTESVSDQGVLAVLVAAVRAGCNLRGVAVDSVATLFGAMDADESGTLSREEFEGSLRELGLGLPDAQLARVVEMLGGAGGEGGGGGEGDGQVDYGGFAARLAEFEEEVQESAAEAARQREAKVQAKVQAETAPVIEMLWQATQAVVTRRPDGEEVEVNRSLFGKKLTDARALFDAMDKDGGGVITGTELGAAMQRLGMGLSEAQLQNVLNVLDTDGDGQVTYEEFVDRLWRHVEARDAEARAEAAARAEREPRGARGGGGEAGEKALAALCRAMKAQGKVKPHSRDEVVALFKDMDEDDSGTVSGTIA